MTEPTRDSSSELEDEGIPDLQDGVPSAQRAEDPQMQPIPGAEPSGVDRTGTTIDEQIHGESLDERLAQEEPDVAPSPATSDEQAYGDDLRDVDVAADELVPPEEAIGEPADSVGRLVEPDQGARADSEKDLVADDAGPDTGGWSPEERAMRAEEEEEQ